MNFHAKQKNKHETKKVYLCLWDRMLKTYYHICNQRPPICLIAKFLVKLRIFKFGTKNALFGFLGSNFEKPLSYLQSVPSNLPYFKV